MDLGAMPQESVAGSRDYLLGKLRESCEAVATLVHRLCVRLVDGGAGLKAELNADDRTTRPQLVTQAEMDLVQGLVTQARLLGFKGTETASLAYLSHLNGQSHYNVTTLVAEAKRELAQLTQKLPSVSYSAPTSTVALPAPTQLPKEAARSAPAVVPPVVLADLSGSRHSGPMESACSLVPLSPMARRLRVSTRWLRSEAEAGRLPHVRAGRRFLFNAEAVESVLLERAARIPEKDDREAALMSDLLHPEDLRQAARADLREILVAAKTLVATLEAMRP